MNDLHNALILKLARHGAAWLFILVLGIGTTAFANTYECSTFSIPGGSTSTTGINNAGIIVGTFRTSTSSPGRGFIRDAAGNIKLFDYPGASSTVLYKINNNGVITGSAQVSGAQVSFTVDLNGNLRTVTLPPPYANDLFNVVGINDNGVLSGLDATAVKWFTLTPSGTISFVGNASTPFFSPQGSLNNSLQLLEISVNGPFFATTLLQPDQTTIPISWNYPAPAPNSYAAGLNNAGAAVGFESTYHGGGSPYVPFLRDPSGVFSEIVCPGIAHTTILPLTINDNGVIAGDNATNPGGGGSFIATPVPGLSQYSATASSLVFPPQQGGQTSAAQTVTITNTGSARMDIGSLAFFGYPGYAPSYFHVTGCIDPTTGFASLAPGASCDLNVSVTLHGLFGIPPPGQYSDRLIIDDNSPGSPHVVSVSVTEIGAQPPSCTVSGVISTGSLRQISFTFQDSALGLLNIAVASASNATTSLPTVTPGITSPLTAYMTEVDPSQPSTVDLVATNLGGLTTDCVGTIAGGASTWSGLTGSIQGKVTVVADSAGNLQAFARGPDQALLHTSQNPADLTWSAWESFGGVIISDPAAALNADGTLEVFAVGGDSALWHRRQTSAGWSNWESLGGIILGNPAVAKNQAGLLELFVRGSDFAIWHNVPTATSSWSGWTSLHGVLLGDPIVTANQDGRLEVFARGGDQRLWQIAQSAAGGASWTEWTSLASGVVLGNPALVKNQAGLLELFARSTDNSLHHNVQSSTDDLAWTGWNSLNGYFTSDPAAALDKDGRLEVFGRGGDNALWHAAQSTPGGLLSDWDTFGGVLSESLTAITDPGGRVEVFARAPDNTLWHIAQILPGQWH